MRRAFLAVLGAALVGPGARAQSPAGPGATVTLAPDTQYRAGALRELLFGAHWRDLWAEPIEVPVLDVGRYAGGLVPVKRGGGKQTKSLRFRGADGKEYKFRSMTKDPKQVLPPELRESVAADIVQDQISSSNPVAAVIVPPLLDAAGILNARPAIVFLPDGPSLGEFREEFGGLLGTIEENPDDPDEDRPDVGRFGGADKFLSTIGLFEELEKDNDDRVDVAEYVKARLMDVFLGDWDRHIDQWRWAGYANPAAALPGGSADASSAPDSAGAGRPKGRRWLPIPRDRDQAFARFDGLFPWIASIAVPQLEGFGREYPEIEDLTWSGRFLDRRLLAGAGRSTWDSLAAHLRGRLTDGVIEGAVREMPAPMFDLEGERLIADLKVRRDNLGRIAREFYELAAEYPEVRLSDKREAVDAVYLPDGGLEISVRKRDRESGAPKGEPFFRRTFHGDETHEVRIFLQGGDDRVRVSGARTASTSLKIVGGKGDDEVTDESTGGGLSDLAPFSLFAGPAVTLYDEEGTKRSTATRIGFDATPARRPATEIEKYEPSVRDYGYDWKFAPWYGASPEEGLFAGGGPILIKHGFRVEPHVYRMRLRGGYATGARKFRADFSGDFRAILPGRRLTLDVEYSQLEVLNYFGYGNATAFDDALSEAGTYEADTRHFFAAPAIHLDLSRSTAFALGAGVRRFAAAAGAAPGEEAWYGSVRFEARFDSRDVPPAATRGVLSLLRYSDHHPFTGGAGSYRRLSAEFRAYLTPGGFPATLAVRGVARRNWGAFPWYESVFLGGSSNPLDSEPSRPGGEGIPLRGYEPQRFAGRSGLAAGLELRMNLASFMFLVPVRFGVTAGGETGRVWAEGESSDRWHPVVVGGIWFSFVGPANVLSLSFTGSPERTGFYLSAGFGF